METIGTDVLRRDVAADKTKDPSAKAEKNVLGMAPAKVLEKAIDSRVRALTSRTGKGKGVRPPKDTFDYTEIAAHTLLDDGSFPNELPTN